MNFKFQIFVTLLLGIALIPLQGLAQSTKAKGYIKERVLVKFKNGVSEEKIAHKLNSMNSRVDKKIDGPNIHVIKLPPGLSEASAAKRFKEDLDVEFAEIDEVIPNDPYYSKTWGLNKISASYAWDVTKGSTGITIAILDSGIDPTHPDLASSIVPGWNVASNNSQTSPITSHGTRVAGVAAARINNSLGVSGLCGNCKIMPVRITNALDGSASYSSLAAGVTYAANHGARVANASYELFSHLSCSILKNQRWSFSHLGRK